MTETTVERVALAIEAKANYVIYVISQHHAKEIAGIRKVEGKRLMLRRPAGTA